MKKTLLLLFTVLAFLMANESSSQQESITLLSLIGANQILVIGESYGQPESTDFLAKKVEEYISTGHCLNVGLEIPSDQQEILDSAIKGQVSMSDVQIDNVIDHDSYREMLVSFSDEIIASEFMLVVLPPH